MSDLDTAKQEAERAASLPAHQAVEALAERLGAVAAARAVFSDPVERDGVTVIPVARVRWGFGAGGGTGGLEGTKEHGEGGGGVSASPLGYIEISEEAQASTRSAISARSGPSSSPLASPLGSSSGGLRKLLR